MSLIKYLYKQVRTHKILINNNILLKQYFIKGIACINPFGSQFWISYFKNLMGIPEQKSVLFKLAWYLPQSVKTPGIYRAYWDLIVTHFVKRRKSRVLKQLWITIVVFIGLVWWTNTVEKFRLFSVLFVLPNVASSFSTQLLVSENESGNR